LTRERDGGSRQRIDRVLCIHGTGEDDYPCPMPQGEGLHSVELPGCQHLDADFGRGLR
jgi:type IV secretory pathway VirJ component